VTSKNNSTLGRSAQPDLKQQSFSKVRVYLLVLRRRKAKLVAGLPVAYVHFRPPAGDGVDVAVVGPDIHGAVRAKRGGWRDIETGCTLPFQAARTYFEWWMEQILVKFLLQPDEKNSVPLVRGVPELASGKGTTNKSWCSGNFLSVPTMLLKRAVLQLFLADRNNCTARYR